MNETLTRTLSGVVYIMLLVIASLHINSFLLLFGILLLIAVSEFCNLVHIKKTLPMVIAAVGYSLFSYFEVTKNTQILLVGAALFVSVKAFLFLLGKGKNRFDVPSKYVYLIGYLIIPVILITKIPQIEKNFNPKIIISIFILIWTNDTFAFLVGKSIGKRKLFERISPKKTVEGFVGGLLAAMVMGVIISIFFIDQPKVNWIITAAILSIFGTIGDLVESKFKRVANIKDSGNIMPGHGGILDRLDSIIFAAPFVFLFYQIISYVP